MGHPPPQPSPPPLSALRDFIFNDNDNDHYVWNTYYLRTRHLTYTHYFILTLRTTHPPTPDFLPPLYRGGI